MNSISWRAFCVLAGSVLYGAGHAQSVPSLADAVESAWQRAAAAKAADGRIAEARAGRSAAESLWAAPPALELSHYDDRLLHNAGRRESEIGLAWPLWLPGQRSARGELAQADLRLADLSREAAKLRVAGEVREAAWNLAAREAELAVAQAQAQGLQALADDVDRRVRAGDLARADALAVHAELLAAHATLALARQHREAARTGWFVLTGIEPLADAAEAHAGASNPGGDAAEHPEITLAALAVERARSNLDLVQVSKRDPPELIARYRQEAPGNGMAAQNSVGIAVRFPFGTDGRNLPREAAAISEFDVARTLQQRLGERVESAIASARTALLAAEAGLVAEQSRLALLRERGQLIDKSFRAGETPLPELLRALAAITQAEGSVARQQAELGLSRARLNQSLGILP